MDSQDRRSRILRAAAALFLEKGYAGVSMEDVLSAVGGSKSTLYRHFEDKADLFRSAVEMLIDERTRPLKTVIPADCEIAETLTDFGRHLAEILLAPETVALHRLIIAEAERVDGIGGTFFTHGPDFGSAVMGEYLRERVAAGILTLVDPMRAGRQLCHAMLGPPQTRLLTNATPPTAAEIEAGIAHAVTIFLNGALPRR